MWISVNLREQQHSKSIQEIIEALVHKSPL
jgi:hypothetical protein